jgi:hypothetical protein
MVTLHPGTAVRLQRNDANGHDSARPEITGQAV